MKRRTFIPCILATALGTVAGPSVLAGDGSIAFSPTLPPTDADDFWEQIRAQYRTGDLINLNNGGVSPHPLPVEEAFFNYHRLCNEVPSYTMWRTLDKKRGMARAKLAKVAGCLPEEIAINRNTTEALVSIIMQLPLKKGDEVVLSKFDYPRMINAWKMREEQEGIVLKWINTEEGNPSDGELAERYISVFGPETKVVHITHMINWTGRIVPAQQIITVAKQKNITTIVDAAHSFAHVPFNVSEMGCDYLGVSLHKWMGAPFGNGMLYVKKENIHKINPIFPAEKALDGKIEKFEELGTRNNAAEFAIGEAVDFYNHIGAERKYNRLLELRNYWVDQVKDHANIKIHTPLEHGRSGAIALVEIQHKTQMDLDSYLFEKYNIHTVNINHEGIKGIRITPNVYTSKKELDVLVKGLLEMAEF